MTTAPSFRRERSKSDMEERAATTMRRSGVHIERWRKTLRGEGFQSRTETIPSWFNPLTQLLPGRQCLLFLPIAIDTYRLNCFYCPGTPGRLLYAMPNLSTKRRQFLNISVNLSRGA